MLETLPEISLLWKPVIPNFWLSHWSAFVTAISFTKNLQTIITDAS
jgi:hypothetical protein